MAAGGPSKGHAALLLLHAAVSTLRSGAVAVPDLYTTSVESRNQPQPPIQVRQDCGGVISNPGRLIVHKTLLFRRYLKIHFNFGVFFFIFVLWILES